MKKSSFHTLSNGYACLLWSSKHINIKIVMNANFAGDIVALQKPYGLAMFGAELQHSVEKYSQSLANFLGCETLHQVHRLDKITSGILLLAKTKECHLFLVEKFRQRQIKKYYWAIVNGTPQPQHGIINIPLGEAKINNRFRITLIPEVKSSRKKVVTSYYKE